MEHFSGWSWEDYEATPEAVIERAVDRLNEQAKAREKARK